MSNAVVAAPTPSKSKVFLRRLITSVVLWTVIIAALFSTSALISNGVFIGILVLLGLTGLAEFYGLAELRGLVCFNWCGLFGGALLGAAQDDAALDEYNGGHRCFGGL